MNLFQRSFELYSF